VLADDDRHGVVDGNGEVFGYPNLYVLDGACLPSATGVNPSHTIAAVAERNIETVIRKITGQHRWVAPDRKHAVPVVDPLATLRIPRGGTAPPRTRDIGLVFTETMRGALVRGATDPARPSSAAGGHPEQAMSVRLEVTAPSVADFVGDPTHRLAVTGVIRIADMTAPAGARVGGGLIHLLVPGDNPASRRVLYTLPFFGADGKPYLLDGCKEIQNSGWFSVWGANTTVYVRLRRGHAPRGRVLAAGRLRLSAINLVRELTTARVTGTANPVLQARALVDFSQLFAGSLWDVFIRPRVPFLAAER